MSHPDKPALSAAVAAAMAPSLLAWNVSPSTTFLNQAMAAGLWGAFAVAAARPWRAAAAQAWPLLAALGLVALGALLAWWAGPLPSSLSLSALALLLPAAVLLLAGCAAQTDPPGTGAAEQASPLFVAVCTALAVAGAPSVIIGLVQVFAPQWVDGHWIAHPSVPGRAVGNLRQPNHLSTLLMLSCVALVALAGLGRVSVRAAAAGLAALLLAVVLTASRTGTVGVLLLASWGLVDRRLSRGLRALLLAAPLWYLLCWVVLAGWSQHTLQAFGGTARLAEGVASVSRLGVWANTVALIGQHPWVGVGFGGFNFAWTLTPFPERPTAFFDHTHNLPLHLAVELGLPVAGCVLGLLGSALWRAWREAFGPAATATAAGTARRAAVVMVGMVGLHSLLEYPLWYAYFLLPTAWLLGYAIGRPVAPPGAPARGRGWPAIPAAAGTLCVLGAIGAVADYARVVPIFEPSAGAAPLAQRIAAGQRSVLFAHHAHYAAATSGDAPADPASLHAAAYNLLDTRLMMAWARALAAAGQLEQARHLAARLREFRNPASQEWLAACTGEAARPAPFQCEPPSRVLGWEDFRPR